MRYLMNLWRLMSFKLIFKLIIYYSKRLLKIRYTQDEILLNNYYDFLIKNNGIILKKKKRYFICKLYWNKQPLKLALRFGKHSDLYVYEQIFENNDYSIAIEKYKEFFYTQDLIIVDAGANIGLSVLYFKKFFPNSLILAIEPSYDNYLLLRINMYINKIHGILFFRKALWYKNTLCSILTDFRDQLDWSMRITENKNGNIEAITLSDIIYLLKYKFNKNHIDFLKIDIEGAEKELFISGAIQDHLKDIRMLVMEIHEEFIKKNYINKIMCDNNFIICENGETSIYINSI